MRRWNTLVGSVCVLIGFAAETRAADKPQLELTDPQLPLYELRPLDRRVYGLTLDGTWHKPAKSGAHHYVNLLFPNGQSYSTRVDEHPTAVRWLVTEVKNGKMTYRETEDSPFRRGEVRCLIPIHQLSRNGLARGGKFTVVVSVGKSAGSAKDPQVVSNALEVTWPIERRIVRRPPRTRHADPEPVDAMPVPDDDQQSEVIARPKPPKKDQRSTTLPGGGQ